MNRPVVAMTRVECFSAAHRLHNQDLSDEENKKIFGKCNTMHGHNYRVEVTVEGPVDPKTGMIIDLHELKQIIQAVTDQMDHKTLETDVPYFREMISTTENITVFIWDQIRASLPDPSILKEITINETDKNFFRYSGNTA